VIKLGDVILKDNSKKDVYVNLVKDIQKRQSQPEDMLEISALLESMGWNNSKVQQTFGYEDVFSLAVSIWENINSKKTGTQFELTKRISFGEHVYLLVTSFLRGVIFALPMALSVFAMLFLRFSLWSYYYLSLELATSIAIGTIMSFMAIGGFTQAIARRGFYYIVQGYYRMARQMTFYFVRVGYFVCAIVSVVFFLVNLFIRMISINMSLIIVLYFFFLSTIWLSVTVMYILRKELLFTGLILTGIGLVYLLFKVFGVYIITAQIISLFIVTVLGMLIVIYYFNTSEDKMERGIKASLPRMSIILYGVAPYFYYGFLYFTFLFVDRLLAWSRNQDFMPYIIWFKGQYELGLDFSLLTLIIPIGVSEVVVTKLMTDLELNQKNYLHSENTTLNRKYLSLYISRVIVIGVVSIISAIVVYLLVYYINGKDIFVFDRFIETDIMSSKITRKVFLISLISYTTLAIALLNSVILFSFSQPSLVTWSLTKALYVNIIVGFILSRRFEYEDAVYGLLIGTIVFFVLSTYKVIILLRDLDYYIYAGS